ncbi:MAG: hypothetical protein AAF616_04950 [Bacteroidota bacterium]
MKKLLITGVFALLIMSACEETETTTVDISGTATISGTVLGDTEKVNTPGESEAQEGVTVRVLWDSRDLAVISDGDNIRNSLSAVAGTDGSFSFEVPTTDEGVSFDVEVDEVRKDVTFSDGANTVTESVVFSSFSTSSTVRTGETTILEIDLADNFNNNQILDEFATISGIVEADTEQVNTKVFQNQQMV